MPQLENVTPLELGTITGGGCCGSGGPNEVWSYGEEAYDILKEYMFGPDTLVAPILDHNIRNRRVYLPSGATWKNAYTGEKFEGGKFIECDAPIEIIPVFLKNCVELPLYI